MQSDFEILAKRFIELSTKADRGCYFTFTDFLGLAEQSVLNSVKRQLRSPYTLYGGTDGAERIVARFGDVGEIGYEAPFPIKPLMILPKDARFQEKLGHRDYLGALLNLGIERDVLGDIVVREGSAYIFVLEDIADYIIRSLDKVRNTSVRVVATDELPEGSLYTTDTIRITLESERIDAVLARVCKLSRQDAQLLVKKRLVFVDGREIDSVSYRPKKDEVISVRGYGRMIYRGLIGETKRGRLAVAIDIYK